MATFWCTIHHEGKISPGWMRVGGGRPPPFTISTITREKVWVFQSTRPCLSCVTQLMTDDYVHLLYKSSQKFHQIAAGQLLLQGNRYGTKKAGGISHTKSHQPGHSLPASQAGRRVGLAIYPSASLTITYKVAIYAPYERADILPLFSPIPMEFVLQPMNKYTQDVQSGCFSSRFSFWRVNIQGK